MGLINTIANSINGGKVVDTMQNSVDQARNAFEENAGLKGYNAANQAGLKQGAEQANLAAQNAQSQTADLARQGASKAYAGMQGAQQTASAAQSGMQQGYSTGYSNTVKDQSAKINAVLKANALANEQAKTEYAASQARLAQAQAALQGAVSFYNNNLKGMFSQSDQPVAQATGAGLNQNVRNGIKLATGTGMTGTQFPSDERCKDLTPASTEDAFRQIESILYKYTPEAQQAYGVDNDKHVGVTAQSVEKVLPEAVHTDQNGIKSLDKQKLLESVTAGIAAMQKEIDELENSYK